MSVWNRRKEEELTPAPSGPPAPSELAKEGIPMSTLPGRSSEPFHDGARHRRTRQIRHCERSDLQP